MLFKDCILLLILLNGVYQRRLPCEIWVCARIPTAEQLLPEDIWWDKSPCCQALTFLLFMEVRLSGWSLLILVAYITCAFRYVDILILQQILLVMWTHRNRYSIQSMVPRDELFTFRLCEDIEQAWGSSYFPLGPIVKCVIRFFSVILSQLILILTILNIC